MHCEESGYAAESPNSASIDTSLNETQRNLPQEKDETDHPYLPQDAELWASLVHPIVGWLGYCRE